MRIRGIEGDERASTTKWTAVPVVVLLLLYGSLTRLAIGSRQAEVFADSVFVQSVPIGAKVFIAPESDAHGEWRESEASYRGTTPLEIALEPGDYVLAIVVDDESLQELGVAPEFQPFGGGETFLCDGGRTVTEAKAGARGVLMELNHVKSFQLSKRPAIPAVVTALFAKDAISFDDIVALLPNDEMIQFRVENEVWAPFLSEMKIPPEEVPSAMRLLSRTGVLPRRGNMVVLLTADGSLRLGACEDRVDTQSLEVLLPELSEKHQEFHALTIRRGDLRVVMRFRS